MTQIKAAPSARPVLINVNEFCRLYGVRRTRAYELFAAGLVQTALIGRSRLVVVASADAFAEASVVPQTGTRSKKADA